MPSLQLKALQTYTGLATLRPSWAGCLILSVGLDPSGSAIAFAAIVAGAVILTCEPDPQLCRSALRSGACDFVVNTVDEALRVIKNEIRKKNPLSVALEQDSTSALDELSQRGVLPQLFLNPTDPEHKTEAFFADRASQVCLDKDWQLHPFDFEASTDLRSVDSRLRSLIPPDDPRHPWFTTAPRLFPRDRTRHAYLTAAELEQLTAAD